MSELKKEFEVDWLMCYSYANEKVTDKKRFKMSKIRKGPSICRGLLLLSFFRSILLIKA